jgi:hypothetical protein
MENTIKQKPNTRKTNKIRKQTKHPNNNKRTLIFLVENK